MGLFLSFVLQLTALEEVRVKFDALLSPFPLVLTHFAVLNYFLVRFLSHLKSSPSPFAFSY